METIQYYNLKNLPRFRNGEPYAVSAVGKAEIGIAADFLLDNLFPSDVIKNLPSLTGKATYVFKAALGHTLTTAAITSIEIVVNYDDGEIQFGNGGSLAFSADLIAGLGLSILATALIGASAPFWGAALTSAGLSIAYSVIEDVRDSAIIAAVDGFFGLTPVDVKFTNSEGKFREGLFYTDGLSIKKAAVENFISMSSSNLTDGTITFHAEGGMRFGDRYNLFDGSIYEKLSNLLGVSLESFLAAGPTVKNKNISPYTINSDGDPFIYNIDGTKMKIFVPFSDGSQSYLFTANNLFLAANGQSNSLEVGDGDSFFRDTQLLISKNNRTISLKGDHNDRNIIISDETGQTLVGATFNDILIGNGGNDFLKGRGGKDSIFGGEGDDSILGGQGNDSIRGNDGNDSIAGGKGNDYLHGIDGDDSVFGGRGNDTVLGGSGNDIVRGGLGDDILGGWKGSDTLFGGQGNDTLWAGPQGEAWNDVDFLFGGNGNDTLIFEFSTATVSGGDGVDTFVFKENWRDPGISILDLQRGEKLDFSGLKSSADHTFIRLTANYSLNADSTQLVARLIHYNSDGSVKDADYIFINSSYSTRAYKLFTQDWGSVANWDEADRDFINNLSDSLFIGIDIDYYGLGGTGG